MAAAGRDKEDGSKDNPIYLSSDTDSNDLLKQPTAPKNRKLTRKQIKRKPACPERCDQETEMDPTSGSVQEPAKKKMKRATHKENGSGSSQSLNEEESDAKGWSESESYAEEEEGPDEQEVEKVNKSTDNSTAWKDTRNIRKGLFNINQHSHSYQLI